MAGPKVAVIGAGSYFFGRPVIHKMATSPVMAGGTLALVDTDEKVLKTMMRLARRIWEARKKTVLFVTHSINEALILSDRVILLASHPGRVQRDIAVSLPRPRVRTDPDFNAMYQDIWEGLSK